jgi:hypothetical protein
MTNCKDCGKEIVRPEGKTGRLPSRCDDCRIDKQRRERDAKAAERYLSQSKPGKKAKSKAYAEKIDELQRTPQAGPLLFQVVDMLSEKFDLRIQIGQGEDAVWIEIRRRAT